ncbi:hypothetical protein GCM10010390_04890 [Streptomyces mordarskii]|uniref:Uncharacterized protein n=1 Tax=Streptomyces mordarskii TaxID=1226758 RepID=A0ABP3LQP5_9ACTN
MIGEVDFHAAGVPRLRKVVHQMCITIGDAACRCRSERVYGGAPTVPGVQADSSATSRLTLACAPAARADRMAVCPCSDGSPPRRPCSCLPALCLLAYLRSAPILGWLVA